MPADPEGGCKCMRGEAASPTNPEKVHAEKRKTNILYRPRDVSTSDDKCMIAWPRMDLE